MEKCNGRGRDGSAVYEIGQRIPLALFGGDLRIADIFA